MAGISTNSLGRTTKAGEGTAFVFDMSDPVKKFQNLIIQEHQSKKKAEAEKAKINADNASKFRSDAIKMTDKIRYQDLPYFQNRINDMITQMSYMNEPLNPMSPDYPKSTQLLMSLATDAKASEQLAGVEKQLYAQYKTHKDLISPEEWERVTTKIFNNDIGNIIANKDDLSYSPTLNIRDYTMAEFSAKTGKPYLDAAQKTLNAYKKEVNDKGLALDINNNVKDNILPELIAGYATILKEGQKTQYNYSKATDEEMLQYATDIITPLYTKTFYNENKDQDQKLAQAKFEEQKRQFEKKFNLESQKFAHTKSLSEVKTSEMEALFQTIANGGSWSRMVFSNKIIRDPKTNNEVLTGASELITDANGIPIAIKTKTYSFDDKLKPTEELNPIITPLRDSKGNYTYSTSQLYRVGNMASIESKSPMTNYYIDENGDYQLIQNKPNAVGTKTTNVTKNSGSNTNINSNSNNTPANKQEDLRKKYQY